MTSPDLNSAPDVDALDGPFVDNSDEWVQPVEGDNLPFRVLGYNNGQYYYFPRQKKQIVSLAASQHTINNLLQLAPLSYWQENYGHANTSASKVSLFAANSLISACLRKGVFIEEDSTRGTGVWLDAGRTILHCGDRIFVNGVECKFEDIESEYTYIAAARLIKPPKKSLSNWDAARLRQICRAPTWANPLSGDLLAGWLPIAMIGATLEYRPHIYITGESDSGKSTINDKIVKPVLGALALRADGGTTEPAIRNMIGYNGRPLLFDEAEPSPNMDAVLGLARKASTGATVVKLGYKPFKAQFCACFSAINPPVDQTADENRISFLVLKKNRKTTARQEYDDLLALINEVITPDFSEMLLARVIENFESLRKNIATFQKAARKILNLARTAQHIGTLLAGVYLLGRCGEVSEEDAEKFIKENNWEDFAPLNQDSDPMRLFQFICSFPLRFTPGSGNTREIPTGELITMAIEGDTHADKLLRQYAIRVHKDGVNIGDKSPNMAKMLRHTEWGKRWHRTLMDIPGAKKISNDYFTSGVKMNATQLPLALFRNEEKLL